MNEVTLGKPWGGHAAGETIKVDRLRAKTLRDLGFLDKPKPPTPTKGTGTPRKPPWEPRADSSGESKLDTETPKRDSTEIPLGGGE